MNLNEQDICDIANSSTRWNAIQIVKAKIEHAYKSVMDIWRNEILFDLILDLINHCLKKGFSFKECLSCASYLYDCIDQMKKNSKLNPSSNSLANMVDNFAAKLAYFSHILSDHKLKLFMEYIDETLFRHYHLYKYVFTSERENHTIDEERRVICPPKESFQESRLVESKTYPLWEYEQKLSDFDKRERELKERYAIERDRLVRQEEMAKNLIRYIENDANGASKPLDEETMRKMIDDISKPVVEAAKSTLKCEMDEVKQRGLMTIERSKLQKPDDTILVKPSKTSLSPRSKASRLKSKN